MNVAIFVSLVLVIVEVSLCDGAYDQSKMFTRLPQWNGPRRNPERGTSGTEYGFGYGNGDRSGEGYMPKDCDNFEWPWAMNEFATFLGRCETAKMFYMMIDREFPTESVLAHGCPFAYNITERVMGATEEQRKRFENLLESIFHIMQCANLMVEGEWIRYFSQELEENYENTVYYNEARPLFEVCEWVFGQADDEVMRFHHALEKILMQVEVPRETQTDVRPLVNKLRSIIGKSQTKHP